MANVLVIGPHPDDQELGMGGTIARLASQGHDVLLLDVTDGCPTPRGDRPTRLAEAAEAAKELSGPGKTIRRVLLDLPNRRVVHSIESRHAIAGVIRAHQASVLFIPHPEDAHPDHLAVTRNAEDARFDAKLTSLSLPGDLGKPPLYPRWVFYYYCSHLRKVPDPSFIMDISGFEERKARAIAAYKSQFAQNPLNVQVPEWIAAADRYFGSRIGTGAGEPFWCREPLGLTGLDGLP
jgi:bacillithiol biosynthesis deacetylase BshB1